MRRLLLTAALAAPLLLGVTQLWPSAAQDAPPAAPPAAAEGLATAVLAGGCFWCMEPPYDKLPGVVRTTSGYIGGDEANPTYEQVSAGTTGHTEAVEITYDPKQVSYPKLLEVFWRNIDPVTPNAQFCDQGSQYRSGIFYQGDEQKRLAEQSKADLVASGRFADPIVTEVTAAGPFYAAEDYHQDYYQKNPVRYRVYRQLCGRDDRLAELWGEQPAS